jgi:DNA-binding CsgD family transcriptional regulator
MGSGSVLSARDGRLALALADGFAFCRDERELREQVAELPQRIGADSVLVSGLSITSGLRVLEPNDATLYRQEMLEAVDRHWQEHPVLVADRHAPARGARRLSDHVGRRWRRGGLFAEFYRPLGMTRELSVQLSWEPDGSTFCFAFHRAGTDFRERELALMERVSPHLWAAYRRIRAERLLEQRLDLLERGVECGLVIDRAGRLITVGASARDALERWFGSSSSMLPAALLEWWAAVIEHRAGPELELRAGDSRLRAELVRGVEEDLILLGEKGADISPAHLARRLPITPREAEVLARLAGGRTNDGIAFDLGISRHTVVRHVERIYRKLGIHSRAAATRAALDALHVN